MKKKFSTPAWIGLLGLCLAACLTTGCSGDASDAPELGSVRGQVTLDGDPLADAEITFQPAEGRPSMATTDENGLYELMYITEPGAKIGEHTVKISKKEFVKDAQGEIVSAKELLPAKYNTQSTLNREVKAGDNSINFELESR